MSYCMRGRITLTPDSECAISTVFRRWPRANVDFLSAALEARRDRHPFPLAFAIQGESEKREPIPNDF